MKKGQSKPGVKFSKVNRVQSGDGGEEDDGSCIDSEVSSDSSMSVDRPPKSLVWKDRPKSRKVSKIRTVSTIHRTTRMERTRPTMPHLNQTSVTPQPQSMRSKHRPSRYPSHLLRRQSQHKPFNPLYKRGRERSYHGHMDQDCQVSGHIPARNGTTPTLRSRARTTIRPDLVGHSQCPNIKIATRRE